MPAVHVARLKIEVNKLLEFYKEPELFCHHLKDLLFFYADRTRRPQLKNSINAQPTAYAVPQPVFREIANELGKLLKQDQISAFALLDKLWEEPILEFRQLAVEMLAIQAPQPSEPIVSRMGQWLAEIENEELLDALIKKGYSRLRLEQTHVLEKQIEKLLLSEGAHESLIGLLTFQFLIEPKEYQDLPLAYRLISPVLTSKHRKIRLQVVECLKVLVKKSPTETTRFLSERLSEASSPELLWYCRQTLPFLPQAEQTELRMTLQEQGKAST